MVQEWYLLKGLINAEAIEQYLEAMDAYNIALPEARTKLLEWESSHSLYCEQAGVCTCPPQPRLPVKPTLDRSPDIPKDRLRLEYVMKHPGCRWPTH